MYYLRTVLLLHLSIVFVKAILGGREAAEGEFPYAVRLSGDLVCSGCLITLSKVVTAAHCFLQYNEDGSEKWINLTKTVVVAGSSNILRSKEEYRDRSIQSYQLARNSERRKLGGVYHDIAIAELNIPFSLSDTIKPITIPSKYRKQFKKKWKKFLKTGKNCQTLGWGMTKQMEKNGKIEISEFSSVLKVIEVIPLSEKACKTVKEDYMTKDIVCAKPAKMGDSILQGDPGGALICSGRVWGVSSSFSADKITKNETIIFTLFYNYLEDLGINEAEANSGYNLIPIPLVMLTSLFLTQHTI